VLLAREAANATGLETTPGGAVDVEDLSDLAVDRTRHMEIITHVAAPTRQ
jgi:hypothetical protein